MCITVARLMQLRRLLRGDVQRKREGEGGRLFQLALKSKLTLLSFLYNLVDI